MFKKVLSKPTANILALLSREKFFKKVYLVGGTALALQLGHRLSYDLGFYIKEKFNEDFLLEKLKKIADFQETTIDKQTILGDFPQVKFSIFYYKYRLIKKPKKFSGIKIASIEDIGAMKIGAIAGRGTKRDFIDLYFLTKKNFSLKQLLNFYDKKFSNLSNIYSHIIKSLIYFEDAEEDEMPPMLRPCIWKKVKEYFFKEVPKVLDQESKKLKK